MPGDLTATPTRCIYCVLNGGMARVLFGGGGDWRKFHETCTFFAIAALEERDLEVRTAVKLAVLIGDCGFRLLTCAVKLWSSGLTMVS